MVYAEVGGFSVMQSALLAMEMITLVAFATSAPMVHSPKEVSAPHA